MKVIEFAFIGYPVRDLQRSRLFYEGALGFSAPRVLWGDLNSAEAWIEYDVGPHTLVITNAKPDWQPSEKGPAVALEVEDFDQAIAALRNNGVTFDIEPFSGPTCSMALISDPDGNKIAIHKRKSCSRDQFPKCAREKLQDGL